MFGFKKADKLQGLLENLQNDREKDREMYAAEAEKNRQFILDYIDKNNKAQIEEVAEEIEQETAAYALNLCTVSVSQIIDYNDLGIMEQEYDNILNNLNLQNFPKDEALLKILKEILDVISFFRIQDGEKKLVEEQYKKKVKNAIWSAVPNPTMILAGGQAGWVGLAVSAISAVGTGYMNYRKERAKIDDEKKQKDWELQKSAMEQFHALRRELFDTAWRLADAYDFGDNLRLTASQITQYNKMLVEENAIKRYERLEYVKDKFTAYPPFLYNLGHAAAEVYHNKDLSEKTREAYKEKARSAFCEFMKITDRPLLREDKICAACALELFALVVNEEKFEFKISKDKILDKNDLLEIAANNSGNAFDTLQLCASAYLELGENKKAMELLRMLVNEDYNAEMNAQLLSMLYISIQNDDCKKAHETLMERGYKNFMFPWPDNKLDSISAKSHTMMFLEEQNRYLFENYKITVGDYITQCQGVFDEILKIDSDISSNILDFLNGIKADMTTLFGAAFAEDIYNLLGESLIEQPDLTDILENAKLRRANNKFNFDSIGSEAIKQLAYKIREQVDDIRSHGNDNDCLKITANLMNNLFLFKTQTKLLGGTAIKRNEKESDKKTWREQLESHIEKNKADKKFMEVIKKYENKLVLENNNKFRKANFITENVLASSHIKKRHYINENVSDNKIIAYLDTSDDDILFTTEGIYRFGTSSPRFAEYNSGKIKLIDNNKIQIDDLDFSHKCVDIKMLYEMIEELSKLASNNRVKNVIFSNLVGFFPSAKSGNYAMRYITSV